MRGGIDKGFCFVASRLSYRRKFIRSLWICPLLLAATVWFTVWVLAQVPGDNWFMLPLSIFICLASSAGSMTYNYIQWKREPVKISEFVD